MPDLQSIRRYRHAGGARSKAPCARMTEWHLVKAKSSSDFSGLSLACREPAERSKCNRCRAWRKRLKPLLLLIPALTKGHSRMASAYGAGRARGRLLGSRLRRAASQSLIWVLLGWMPLAGYGAKLVIKGSDTLGAKLVPQLAETFNTSAYAPDENITIEIAAEGSATGIASVLDATSDIGMLSRGLRRKEQAEAEARGLDLQLIEVARDGLVVIVNEANPVREMTMKQLAAIFTGDIENWAALSDYPEPISAYSRNTSSGTYVAFQQLALDSRDYSNRIQKMAGNEQIAHEVAGNPGAIGYVSLAYARQPGIRTIRIDGYAATDPDYPLVRPLYFLVSRGQSNFGLSRAFIRHVLDDASQALVQKLDFLPAPSKTDE